VSFLKQIVPKGVIEGHSYMRTTFSSCKYGFRVHPDTKHSFNVTEGTNEGTVRVNKKKPP
jgi:hypothetical protein